MLKKTLPAAIALAGGLGLAGAANAVNVNHDGTGQVLLFDWYTVEDGIDTLISVTNTTDQAVALKVRFVESMNSQEVLDFNLYLSPYDMWAGAVSATTDGAKLTTSDTSCTVPAITGPVPFRNYQYLGSDYNESQGGPQGLDRTRTGYLEVIEMGVLSDEDAADSDAFNPKLWATHDAGVPNNCAGLVAAWGATSGEWGESEVGNPNLQVSVPQGGQYGLSAQVNVASGSSVSTDAVALDNFAHPSEGSLHKAPGSVLPSLEDAAGTATLPDGTRAVFTDAATGGLDAVSTVLMMEALMNDYITASSILASTDWVVTFPTKRFYVNNWTANADGNPTAANNPEPFTSFWTDASVGGEPGSACETIDISYWNREEGEVEVTNVIDFSPTPDVVNTDVSLCYEANILSINGSDVAGGGYTRSNLDLETGYDAGWMSINFTGSYKNAINAVTYHREIALNDGVNTLTSIEGLPTIGHAVFEFLNSGAGGAGVLANYQYSSSHKAKVTDVVISGT